VAQGVKLLTLKEGEKLQDVSIVIPDGEDERSADSSQAEVPTDETQAD
jgi:hypothetical protein